MSIEYLTFLKWHNNFCRLITSVYIINTNKIKRPKSKSVTLFQQNTKYQAFIAEIL